MWPIVFNTLLWLSTGVLCLVLLSIYALMFA